MAQSPDHPELTYVQASGYTVGRPGAPLWIVIHDMEADETPNTAENTAQYFATGAGGRDVSSHYCADNNSIVQCVLLKDTAWTVGNTQGNGRGINWELAGFIAQTREQWLDDFDIAMFNLMAPIIRSDATRYGIPLEHCTRADLAMYKPGVTSHWDLGVVFGGTDHTDPGPNFPWDYFMALLNGAPLNKKGDTMYALKASDSNPVYLSNGLRRRTGFTWAQFNAMATAGLITRPTGVPVDSSGWVMVVPPGELDAYGGPLDVLETGGGGGTLPGNYTVTFNGTGTASPA